MKKIKFGGVNLTKLQKNLKNGKTNIPKNMRLKDWHFLKHCLKYFKMLP